MKIALIAPIVESIPPVAYGGIELIVSLLAEGLAAAGHDVTLLASGDSKTSAKLVSTFPQALRRSEQANDRFWEREMRLIGLAESIKYLNQHAFDIIHSHLDWKMLPFEPLLNGPLTTTLHGPLNVPAMQAVYTRYPHSRLVSLSHAQRRPLPDLHYVANVYNGIDTSKFSYQDVPEDYFLFLGRISPEKGPTLAIEAAKRANINLIMAAKIDPVDQEFFDKEVKPLIDGVQIQFIGEVNHQQKIPLLQKAKGMLFPIQWEEPFGLVMTEAMACGTPVIAFHRGSVPEVIIDKKTGFIVDTLEEMVEAVPKISSLKRIDCHTHVKENFSLEKMVADYEQAYKDILEHGK